MSTHQLAHGQHRRSTRIEHAVPLIIQGVGAMREAYQEQVSTVSISCHGCSFQSKHEVPQGEIVILNIKPPVDGAAGYSGKGRVKWLQKVATREENPYQIGVELEVAGNVWGLPSPPPDWFPVQLPQSNETPSSVRELKVVARNEQQLTGDSNHVSLAARKEAAGSPTAPLAQLMFGLGEQIQTMASEAAATALSTEKKRLIEELRAQIRDEAVRTVRSEISASKEVLIGEALKELREAQEATAKSTYAAWVKRVQQDVASASQHVQNRGKEVTDRLDGIAVSTVEHVQRKMETTRAEAVDRFVARLREQVLPMLTEAKDALQALGASEAAFRKGSEEILSSVDQRLGATASARLTRTQDELERNSSLVSAKTNEALLKLYRSFEKTAQDTVASLLASLGNEVSALLEEKAAEVSRQFTVGLEGCTRTYLASLGQSIAEMPLNVPGRKQDESAPAKEKITTH